MGLEQSRYAGGTYEASRASPLAILFAEDSRVTRQLIHLVLTKRGHQVDAVDDGERALPALQNHAYDVALVDFHLPKLDGLQVVTQFKATSGEDRRHPHFVGFTADIEGLLAHPSNCEILDLVVGKPVDIVHLSNVLEQLQRYVDEGRGHAVQPESRPEGEVGVPSDNCDRRASRRMRVTAGTTTLILQTGEWFPCSVRDLSLGGAALEVKTRPAIGQLVMVGQSEGRVVRHTKIGIALEFTKAQSRTRPPILIQDAMATAPSRRAMSYR